MLDKKSLASYYFILRRFAESLRIELDTDSFLFADKGNSSGKHAEADKVYYIMKKY